MNLRTLALLGAAALAACGTGDAEDPGRDAAPPYEAIQVEENFMVPMRDEVRLATDVYRPGRDGAPVDERFPVLLHRTPYDKASDRLSEQARWFASRGYVVVVQDMRGLYFSEGLFQKYHEFDAPDGFDTIEWITGLDYVSPSVGMWGTSYGAHTQADAAKLNPPGLETLVLTMGGLADAWTHKVRMKGGCGVGQELRGAQRQLAGVTDEPDLRAGVEAKGVGDGFRDSAFRKGGTRLTAARKCEDDEVGLQNHGD